jgi:hypothetical protein
MVVVVELLVTYSVGGCMGATGLHHLLMVYEVLLGSLILTLLTLLRKKVLVVLTATEFVASRIS